jgi:CO/xanthine dehydrogenase FAD-binding subunit
VHEAELELVSRAGARRVPYRDFHTGYKTSLLSPGELIAKIRLPRPLPGVVSWWRKVGTRRAQAISKVAIAGWARPQGEGFEVRVALGSVAPTCVRCPSAEAAIAGKPLTAGLIEEAKTALARDIAPIDDIRSTREYRLRVSQNLLAEFLGRLAR